MHSELLTAEDVSKYFKLAKQTVYDYVYKRRIPYFKAGGKLVFSREELDKWLKYGGDRKASDKVIGERLPAQKSK